MLTLQEIQSVTFEKAVFGGYDMKSVDVFVEKVTENYGALQKENAALKAKMKVLVDKIEEYRSVEDGMRKALLSAQNIASETIEKAKKEKEEILKEARDESENKVAQYASVVQEEKAKLVGAKQETRQFIQMILRQYADAIQKLQILMADQSLVGEEKEPEPTKEPKGHEIPKEDVHTVKEEKMKDSISEELKEYMNGKMQDEHSDQSNTDSSNTGSRFDFGEMPVKRKDHE